MVVRVPVLLVMLPAAVRGWPPMAIVRSFAVDLGHRGRNNGNGYGAGLYPWYGGYSDYWDDPWAYGDYGPNGPPNDPGYQPQSNGAAPSVIVMQSPQRMAPAAPAPSPKLVEVPLKMDRLHRRKNSLRHCSSYRTDSTSKAIATL